MLMRFDLQMADLLDAHELERQQAAGISKHERPGCLWTVLMDCPENDEPASKMYRDFFGEAWCRARWSKKELRSGGLFNVPLDVAEKRKLWTIDQCVRFFHDGVVVIPVALAALYNVKTCSV